MHGTEEASNDGRVRVRIIHELNISHKELTYLLQKSISHRNKVLHVGERSNFKKNPTHTQDHGDA